MTTHPILGPIAPVESLGRATLEAIESSGGCSIPKVLVDINARGLELPAFGQWLPIETAPRNGDSILLTSDGYVAEGYWSTDRGRFLYSLIGPPSLPVTHWMPRPAPPAKDSP